MGRSQLKRASFHLLNQPSRTAVEEGGVGRWLLGIEVGWTCCDALRRLTLEISCSLLAMGLPSSLSSLLGCWFSEDWEQAVGYRPHHQYFEYGDTVDTELLFSSCTAYTPEGRGGQVGRCAPVFGGEPIRAMIWKTPGSKLCHSHRHWDGKTLDRDSSQEPTVLMEASAPSKQAKAFPPWKGCSCRPTVAISRHLATQAFGEHSDDGWEHRALRAVPCSSEKKRLRNDAEAIAGWRLLYHTTQSECAPHNLESGQKGQEGTDRTQTHWQSTSL